jgi:hypothetical protein
MICRVAMTGCAGSTKSLELAIFMTTFTGNICMRIYQGKIGTVMIKSGILPRSRNMTGRAIRAKPAIMFIILLMAGITIHWSAFEDAILMTGRTFDTDVAVFELECEQIVINIRAFPVNRGMAGFTIGSIFSIMLIISRMADVTIFWSASVLSIGMAFLTGNFHMFPY